MLISLHASKFVTARLPLGPACQLTCGGCRSAIRFGGCAGVFLAFVIIFGLSAQSLAQTPKIWLAPPDPFSRGPLHWRESRPDFVELFSADAPWVRSASTLSAYKVGPELVDYAPMDVLRRIFADLQRRGIPLAWEMGAVPPGTSGCGTGTEGYAGDTRRSVGRIKDAGGQLRYVAMDEPFWYGSYAVTRHSCRFSLADLARGVAERLDVVRAAFPDVEAGDIEPVGNPPDDQYVDKLIEWARAFHEATGRPLAFFHADINWNGIWKRQLPDLIQKFHSLNISVGTIINGNPAAGSNEGWCDSAIEHEQQIVDIAGIHPDQMIFQSWDHLPTLILPETDTGTMTNLLLQGSRPAAIVSLTATGAEVRGRVTDPSGQPVAADTQVNIFARDSRGIAGMHVVKVTGVVPSGAFSAVFALRVGLECDCGGPIDVSIGELSFGGGNDTVVRRSFRPGPGPFRLDEDGGRKLSLNSSRFPVVEAQPFTIEVPLGVREHSNRPGYLALIFLNKNGGEVRRVIIELLPPNEAIGIALTGMNGYFRLSYPGGLDLSGFALSGRVAGTEATRQTVFETAAKVD